MPNTSPERRRAPRYPLDIRVRIERSEARTLDLSSSGLYLLTTGELQVGDEVSVELALPRASDLGPRDLRLRARVLRVDPRWNGAGVAAAIEAWEVVSAGAPEQAREA